MGYDPNLAAVIFGPEIRYNADSDIIEMDPDQYHDKYGKIGTDKTKLASYIINIYKNMMYRGICGTFVYVCDPALREYMKHYVPSYKRNGNTATIQLLTEEESIGNNRAVAFLDIVAAAGDFMEQLNAVAQQWIDIGEDLHDRHKYFVCQVKGESMNKKIRNGAYCLFRHDEGGSREGKIVLVQSNDIQDAD